MDMIILVLRQVRCFYTGEVLWKCSKYECLWEEMCYWMNRFFCEILRSSDGCSDCGYLLRIWVWILAEMGDFCGDF